MIGFALEALAASAALMLAVLLVRGPVRRAFGPDLAYALWAIPALRLLLPPLPAAWREQVAAPIPDTFASMGHQASALIVPYVDVAPIMPGVEPSSPLDLLAPAALLLWGVGAAGFLLWQLARYWRFRVELMRAAVPLDRDGRVEIVESEAATGPLAFGILHRVVAFPRDFAERYDEGERALALAHELGHHRRGDLYANWVALAVLALHWFNPLAWFAYRAFRADQEMANDAGVIARLGAGARHAYGCAIVKAAHGRALTPACHLHTIKDLKGRLRMLGKARASRTRRMVGGVLGASLSAGALALTASGTQAAERMRTKVETVTGIEIAALEPAALVAPITAPIAAVRALAPPAAPPAPAAPDVRKPRVVTVVRNGETRVYKGAEAEAYIAANPVPVPPVPPVPPMPNLPKLSGIPAVPPVPAMPPVPVVAERNCGASSKGDTTQMVVRRTRDGREVTVICTDRIAAAGRAAAEADRAARAADRDARAATRQAEWASRRAEWQARHAEAEGERAQRYAAATQRRAMTSALQGLERARANMARNEGLYGEHRAEALAGMDEAIADMRKELREIGHD